MLDKEMYPTLVWQAEIAEMMVHEVGLFLKRQDTIKEEMGETAWAFFIIYLKIAHFE